MFNSVQLIRDICKKRGIPAAKLEKDCGFSNGYLNPKKMSKIPYDRAVIIAEYLGLSANYLLTGTEESAPVFTDKRAPQNIIRIAARDGSYQERQLTDQQLAALQAILDQMPDVPDGL